MSRVLNSFESIKGLRNSYQVLYQNNLYCKHSGTQWRCNRCISMLSVYEKKRIVTKEPSTHIGHEDFPPVRIDVLKAIKKMKDEAYYDTSTPLRTIYDRNVKLLLNAKYKLTDIQALTYFQNLSNCCGVD